MSKVVKAKVKQSKDQPSERIEREIPIKEKMYLTPADIAVITGCGRNTVYEWFRISGFPLIKVGQKRLAKRELFFEWFEHRFSVTN